MKRMMNRIQYDWHNAILNNEDHILKANAEEGWRLSKIFLLILYLYSFGIFSLQLIPEMLNMSISTNVTRFIQHVRGEFFVDQDKYHALILSYSIIFFICAIIASAALALQWNMIINHACGMFAIFGYRLEHVFHHSSRKSDRKDSVKKILVRTVEWHKEIIKYVATVNSNYLMCYAPLLIMAISILSTFLVQAYIAIKSSARSQEILVQAILFIICVIYMFIDSASAQKLIDASSKAYRQMYCGEWYNASISDQKMLLFIMQNCMKPATITTANIITMSLEKFGTVFKVSISCFTVLYSLS